MKNNPDRKVNNAWCPIAKEDCKNNCELHNPNGCLLHHTLAWFGDCFYQLSTYIADQHAKEFPRPPDTFPTEVPDVFKKSFRKRDKKK